MSTEGGRAAAWLLVGALAICTVLYAFGLGDVAFLGKDEPKNAQAAREMLERGDWVLTTLGGQPWYDKPILYYWTAIVGYRLFGVGELGARVGPAAAALLTVWLTWVLARRILSRPRAAALAALVLGTGLEFWWFARTAVTDALLACCVTASLVAYRLAREGIRPGWNLHLAWAAAAAGTLAKGPIGLLIPAMVIGADLALARDWRGMLHLRWLTGLLVAAAVAGPWYVLATVRSGGQFFQDFIIHYNLERFATDNLPHQAPAYYYIPVLLLGPFPWSVFLPIAAVRLAREWRTLEAVERARFRFLALWITLPFVFFSLAGSKLPSYLLPTFPALAILIAWEIGHRLRVPRPAAPFAIAILTFILVAGAIAVGAPLALEPALAHGALPLCVVLGGTAAAALAMLLAGRRRAAVVCVALCATLAPVAVVGWGLAPVEAKASAKQVALAAMRLDPAPGQLLSFRFYDNSFFFYTDSRVERLWDRRWIEDRVDQQGSALCFVREQDLPEMAASDRFTLDELAREGSFHLLRLRSTSALPAGPGPAGGSSPPDS